MNGRRFSRVAACGVWLFLSVPAGAELYWDADSVSFGIQEGAGVWEDGGGANWTDLGTNVAWSNARPTVATFGALVSEGSPGLVSVGGTGVVATGMTFNREYTVGDSFSGKITLVSSGEGIPAVFSASNDPERVIARINAGISGSSDFEVSGTFYLTNTSSYPSDWTGNVHLDPALNNPARVYVYTPTSISNTTTITVESGSAVNFGKDTTTGATSANSTYSMDLILNGWGDGGVPHRTRGAINMNSGVPGVVLAGTITIASTSAISNGGNTLTISGVIQGSETVVFNSTGTTVLAGVNTNTGDYELWRGALHLNSTEGPALNGNLGFNYYATNHYSTTASILQDEQIVDTAGIVNKDDGDYTKTVDLGGHTETIAGIEDAAAGKGIVVKSSGAPGKLILKPGEGAVYDTKGQINGGDAGTTIALEKDGPGTQILSGTSVCGDGTLLKAGALVVNGSLTSNVTLEGGVLGGTGTVVGNVTADGGGSLSPGQSAGILIAGAGGAVDLAEGGGMIWELAELADSATGAPGEAYDLLVVPGDLVLGGASRLELDFSAVGDPTSGEAFWTSVRTWKIIDVGGATTGGFGSIVNGSFAAGSFATSVDLGQDVWLTFTPGAGKPGDANGDGNVDAADAAILARNWLQSVPGRATDGDFNEDGVVDDLDASILAANWVYTGGGAAAVPEPGTLALVLVGLVGAGTLRRRVAKK